MGLSSAHAKLHTICAHSIDAAERRGPLEARESHENANVVARRIGGSVRPVARGVAPWAARQSSLISRQPSVVLFEVHLGGRGNRVCVTPQTGGIEVWGRHFSNPLRTVRLGVFVELMDAPSRTCCGLARVAARPRQAGDAIALQGRTLVSWRGHGFKPKIPTDRL